MAKELPVCPRTNLPCGGLQCDPPEFCERPKTAFDKPPNERVIPLTPAMLAGMREIGE